jgi:hypothetical protein
MMLALIFPTKMAAFPDGKAKLLFKLQSSREILLLNFPSHQHFCFKWTEVTK